MTEETTTTICGPGVAAVLDAALTLYRDVARGRWSAVVDATPGRWTDPDAARAAFDDLAAGGPTHAPAELAVTVDGDDAVEVRGDRAALIAAVDLWMRVRLGQVDNVCVDLAYMEPLLRLRVTHARDGAWPPHPHSSWGIRSAEVDDSVRVAYDIWKGLGAGVEGRGPITATVRVAA